jgi:high-affinity iron transporter
VLGYLRQTGHRDSFPKIWVGVGVAAAACVLVGAALQLGAGQLSGPALEAFEGGAMLFAFGVLTWMLFWMRQQSRTLGRHLRTQVDAALRGGSGWALVLLAVSAVGREGLETVLFLFAGASAAGSGVAYMAGGVIGFVAAAALGYFVYRGAARLPIRTFFTITGVAVIVLAAGLLSNGMAELHEANVLANLGPRLWDTDALLPMTSTLGRFLHAIIGYDSAPTLTQVVAYWLYLGGALGLFLIGRRPAPASAPARPQAPTTA